ncbi:protein-L-isoaspartate O-methyltransferase [Xylariomycetidae sp. FL2044]|nr:protein-L-isoaspartate O-methyltransferase [Xylariomycetidae sp. FL2044]
MAWRSSGDSNATLIENLWRNGMITEPVVKSAFQSVDRAHYAPSSPYEDSPQPIGHRATISAPHMHAGAVESLLPFILPPKREKEKDEGVGVEEGKEREKKGRTRPRPRPRRVLDIGSGSGYLTHVFAELVGDEGGVVVGVEHIPELRDLAEKNMAKSEEGRAFLRSGRVRFRVGDGRKGWREEGDGMPGVGGKAGEVVPSATTSSGTGRQEDKEGNEGGWDAIHVGAAAVRLHDELVAQLRSPGRMFIPVNDDDAGGGGGGVGAQYIWTVDKDEQGNVTKKKLYGVRYVPLTDAPGK